MVGIVPGGGGGDSGGPAFETTHDFSSEPTYNVPSEEQVEGRTWFIIWREASTFGPVFEWHWGNISGSREVEPSGIGTDNGLGTLPDTGVTTSSISANNSAAEGQVTIRAYDL